MLADGVVDAHRVPIFADGMEEGFDGRAEQEPITEAREDDTGGASAATSLLFYAGSSFLPELGGRTKQGER